ncbi:MAG: nicotinate (nicotinamide) nucleotide adenylyltransferase [Anaerocolumna sp.]|jgi:nicotinate-nucleotide adenylyltransferase|nr:nicotinate (nicotinamide) nucleotide adenylyltransferase [Anaerocolumna sp.]
MSKIGIMGGTFNPIHTAHLILAEEAYEQLGLDKILFMPSKKPPHKLKEEIVSNEHRMNMITLSIQGNEHFELSTLELMREGITYTSDTLRELTLSTKLPTSTEMPMSTKSALLTQENEYYFIVGGDSLFMMESWWEPEVIFRLSHIVVAIRGEAKEDLQQKIAYLTDKYNASIHLLQTPNLEISSHELRQSRNKGKSIRYYVPELVYQYIVDNDLYLIQ